MEASDAIEGVIPGRDEGEIPGGDAVMEHEAPELTKMNSVGFYMNRFQELVGDVPNDFEAWTSLIAHVEKAHPNDIERICLIYDAFLSEYPLCYGYWNKYANHKARLCTLHEVEETYERAVLAVPYSVDIWVKYCSFGALTYEDPMDIRRLYERGLSFVKKDYFCHQLWDKYIEYEYSIQQWSQLAHIHIRTLVFPTKKLQSYYERFKKLVDIWSQTMGCQQDLELPRESMPLSRGMTDIKDNEYLEISNLIKEFMDQKGDHSKMAFRKYLSLGDQLYNRSRQIDEKICCFEACIRRRYFHLKPLDSCQIDNWHQYLDFAEMQGDFDWTVKLYERCLIACASYSEFWIRYVEFVDAKGGREIANDALGRALTIFLKRVPAFHVYSAMYKEKIGDFSAARALVKQGLDLGSDFIRTVKKQANMEKRLGNTEVAYQTYERAIKLAKENRNFDIIPSLYYNFAQFTFAVSGSIEAARGVFIKGIQQTPCRAILEGLINFTTIHGSASEIPIIDVIIMNAVEPGSSVFQALSDQDREDISSLFVEFVDLYGDIHDVRKAWDRHRKLFPHMMDPSANHASIENSTMNKSRNASNGPGMDLICNGCIVNSNLARDRQQTTILPAQSSYDILEEVDAIGKLNLVINRNDTQEIQLTDAKIMEQSVKQSGLFNVADELVHETNPQCSKFEDNSEPNFDDLRRSPTLDNLSLKSPDVNILPVISTTVIDSELSEAVITVVSSSKVQDGEDAVEASEVHVTLDGKSSSSSQPDQNNESYSFQATGSPAIEAQLKFHQQLNPQSQSNLKHGLPNTIASPQIAGGGGSSTQINKRKQNLEDATSHDGHIQIQVSEHQNCQVQEEAQYPPGGNSSQLPPDQFHPYQSQVWSNTQAPQASQTQALYQIAAAQAYQTANLAWTGQTMQHQGLVYVQSQPSSQPASQTQTYAYQQLNQNSEQYGYTQSGQVFNPQIWQYYQQQMYYLQQQQLQWQQQQQQQQQSQQQNQLTPNSSDLLSQVEQAPQEEEKKSQQMPTRSQQLVIQLQRKQNQKTNQQVHEHASSPEQKHNQPHQQQQQASQLQQQNEQANQTQDQQQAPQLQQQNGQANETQHQQQASHLQQQNEHANQTQQQQRQLLYLQQHQQQQIYMQQQQLYLQQLYQQQLFEQQQQQQQVPQQLQQYQLVQLQQQLFQLQQQQQPRTGTSEVQVQPAGYFQGEESKSQKVEQPERSHSSTPQRTPTH